MTAVLDFKDARQRDEWDSGSLDPLLSQVFLDAAQYSARFLFKTLVITSIWRSVAEDQALGGHGIHPMWRAIDVHADTWTDPVIATLAEFVNRRWSYDPLRMSLRVAVWEPHGTAPHLHLQTHWETKRKDSSNPILPPRPMSTP